MSNSFKKTEKVLYDYKNLDLKIENIDLQIERLKDDVSYANVNFEQKSSPTNAFRSRVENEVIKRDEYLSKEIDRLKRTKNDAIFSKQLIYNSLIILNEEEYKLVDLRYFQKNKKTWIEIGMTLGIDNTTCHRMKNKIINTLTEYIYPNESINDTF